MSALSAVLFDLDGTLIDSAPGILHGFDLAFKSLNLPLARPLSDEIIGPPLTETLSTLLGHHDSETMAALVEAFKQNYDEEGYKHSPIYPGVEELLHSLKNQGHPLFLATNKRHIPTQKIIDDLGWRPLFKDCLSFDSLNPPRNKAGVIEHLIEHHQLDRAESCYVGDRIEDGLASDANRLPFVFATWGYGATPSDAGASHWKTLNTPSYSGLLNLFTEA